MRERTPTPTNPVAPTAPRRPLDLELIRLSRRAAASVGLACLRGDARVIAGETDGRALRLRALAALVGPRDPIADHMGETTVETLTRVLVPERSALDVETAERERRRAARETILGPPMPLRPDYADRGHDGHSTEIPIPDYGPGGALVHVAPRALSGRERGEAPRRTDHYYRLRMGASHSVSDALRAEHVAATERALAWAHESESRLLGRDRDRVDRREHAALALDMIASFDRADEVAARAEHKRTRRGKRAGR